MESYEESSRRLDSKIMLRSKLTINHNNNNNKMYSMKIISKTTVSLLLVILLSNNFLSNAQFLPHSNLGRLVQSIAGSPLVFGLPQQSHNGLSSGTMSGYDLDGSLPTRSAPSNLNNGPNFGPSDLDYAPHASSSFNPIPVSQSNAIYGTDPVNVDHQYKGPARPFNLQHQLQSAPSQQRGVPQPRPYGHSNQASTRDKDNRYSAANYNNNSNNDDDDDNDVNNNHKQNNPNDDDEPRQLAPSATRQQQQQQQQEGYQMGAYLGPSMDDKELNGVFNSNNDERDDVDSGPGSGYDEGASEMRGSNSGGLQKQQSANQPMQNYGMFNNNNDNSDYSPFNQQINGLKSANRANSENYSNNNNNNQFNGNDEESADEDEPSSNNYNNNSDDYPRRSVPMSSAKMMHRHPQAATSNMVKGNRKLTAATTTATKTKTKPKSYSANQYANSMFDDANSARTTSDDSADDQERKVVLPRFNNQNGPMIAAANGYAPFGYGASGPVDLGSMLAGLTGQPNNQGYQVYQGDGSANYPGQEYYNQQGNNNQNQNRQQRQQLARQASSRSHSNNNNNGNNLNNYNAGYFNPMNPNNYNNQLQLQQQQQFNADGYPHSRQTNSNSNNNNNNNNNSNRDQRENRDTNEDSDNEPDDD